MAQHKSLRPQLKTLNPKPKILNSKPQQSERAVAINQQTPMPRELRPLGTAVGGQKRLR